MDRSVLPAGHRRQFRSLCLSDLRAVRVPGAGGAIWQLDHAVRPDLHADLLHGGPRAGGSEEAENVGRALITARRTADPRHSGAREARAMMCNCTSENPYPRSWLWIPGLRQEAHPGMTDRD